MKIKRVCPTCGLVVVEDRPAKSIYANVCPRCRVVITDDAETDD